MTFQAFTDDCGSYTLGNLTFENNADYLSVYGDIQIQRDQQGLQHLLALMHLALHRNCVVQVVFLVELMVQRLSSYHRV